jgi:F0F1-type ATP synthase membrane subunit b/b'
MPQLNSAFYFSQCFWMVLSLGALFLAFKKCIIPRMDRIISNRNRRIENLEADVDIAKSEAFNARSELDQIRESNIKKTAEIVELASKKSNDIVSAKLEALKNEAEIAVRKKRDSVQKEMSSLASSSKIVAVAKKAFDGLFCKENQG